MWCHPLTGIGLRRSLQFVALGLLFVALTTTQLFVNVSHAVQSTNRTISFQGRLQTAAGAVVPDGHYNMQFKIYQGGTGTSAGNPGGTLRWTETYINNNANTGIEVSNGFFSVSLGSVNPFGTSVDWDQDTLFLSMNVAGSAAACTTFNNAPCAADGEMLPMKQITASPYAINAGAVNGKTADNFVQLAQGVQTDASTNTSSIHINKTGSGNLIQLQNTATDVFTVENDGDLVLGSNTNKSISVSVADPNTDGRELAIVGGAGGSGTGTTGGTLSLQGGAAGGTNGNGGDVEINAGAGTGTGTDGTIAIGESNTSSVTIGSTTGAVDQTISIGANNTAGSSTDVIVGSGSGADSGSTIIQAKNAVTIETDGVTRATFSDGSNTVYFGNGVTAAAPNDFTLQATGSSTADVNGGSLAIQGGDANAGNANGGNVTIAGGSGSGTGASGLVVINTPTFATVTNDANCYAGGSVVASSCTISNSTVNNAASVVVGFSTTAQTASLPDPAITTAGRIMYVTAASASEDFTLSLNGGGAGNTISIRKNVTASLLWNGSDWTSTGASTTAAPYSLSGSSADGTPNVQIGDGEANGAPTLFTVDKAASAPIVTDDSLLGSMYYDTTLGKLQCYEAKGWGSCGSSPDTYVTLSPEYTNAVTNGNGIGTMTTDLCSDTLDINDGSSGQPTVCGTNETYNFYNWTSTSGSAQTKSIYVTYKLPSTFKEFTENATSLMARTDDADSSVTYQIYRNNGSGLTSCGSQMSVSTGSQSSWQTKVADGSSDPSSCSFAAGDSIVFKINLSAHSNANAYAANLGFTYSNK